MLEADSKTGNIWTTINKYSRRQRITDLKIITYKKVIRKPIFAS